jgi:uncharacterized integral membrane protein
MVENNKAWQQIRQGAPVDAVIVDVVIVDVVVVAGEIMKYLVFVFAAFAQNSAFVQNDAPAQKPTAPVGAVAVGAVAVGAVAVGAVAVGAASKTLRFADRDWEVRDSQSELSGPGPNRWDARNVWVDATGALHLKIARREGVWSCAEVTSRQRLGFGSYEFRIESRIDRFDPNIVGGLFLYPTPEVGPDGTHEIDIEWAHWGHAETPIGNYTVWPARADALKKHPLENTHPFPMALSGDFSTHRWIWERDAIDFASFHGYRLDDAALIHRWRFAPPQAADYISQSPMLLHFNLWLFRGHAPLDNQEVEMVIRDFRFTSAKD